MLLFYWKNSINDNIVYIVLFLTLPLFLFCLLLPQHLFILPEIIASAEKNQVICGTELTLKIFGFCWEICLSFFYAICYSIG